MNLIKLISISYIKLDCDLKILVKMTKIKLNRSTVGLIIQLNLYRMMDNSTAKIKQSNNIIFSLYHVDDQAGTPGHYESSEIVK